MKHIYEYLIGGKKTGSSIKQQADSLLDLKIGDVIYWWNFDSHLEKKAERNYMITNITKLRSEKLVIEVEDEETGKKYDLVDIFKEKYDKFSATKGDELFICFKHANGFGAYSIEKLSDQEVVKRIKKAFP